MEAVSCDETELRAEQSQVSILLLLLAADTCSCSLLWVSRDSVLWRAGCGRCFTLWWGTLHSLTASLICKYTCWCSCGCETWLVLLMTSWLVVWFIKTLKKWGFISIPEICDMERNPTTLYYIFYTIFCLYQLILIFHFILFFKLNCSLLFKLLHLRYLSYPILSNIYCSKHWHILWAAAYFGRGLIPGLWLVVLLSSSRCHWLFVLPIKTLTN